MGPCLLSFSNAISLIHELGHAIHNLANRKVHAGLTGYPTSVDLTEIASQLLEQWMFVSSQVKRFSRHYATLSPTYLRH